MSLRFRNTLGGAVEPFEPLEPGHVRMYTCGPTVYAPAHVGNFRSFVFADLVRRTLLFLRLPRDLGDEHHRRRRQDHPRCRRGRHPHRRADRALHHGASSRTSSTWASREPDVMPRATEHIDEMVALIETLIEKGHAYQARTARSSSGSPPGLPTDELARTSIPSSSVAASGWRPTSTTRTTSATSHCGRRPSRASRAGRRRWAKVGPAGTSSARP